MKVCTDATLFGAMAPIQGGEKVLDIGTGTGLLALMAAQLGAGQVTAVELTQAAYEEAQLNFGNSPWSEKLHAIHADIRNYAASTDRKFDLIICNPPFFEQHSKSSNDLRQLARHNDRLPYADLVACVDKLLSAAGLFYLLLPVHAIPQVSREAPRRNLALMNRVDFRGYERNKPKVAALLFACNTDLYMERILTIYSADRVYSEESEYYLSAFLLRFSD